MRIRLVALGVILISAGTVAAAYASVFFEEEFNGTALDSAAWRTEIVTNGPRWCDTNPGQWAGPGTWVEGGEACYGVAAYPPYGSATLSEDMVHLSSENGRAFPYLVSRLPGTVPLFPTSGDFTCGIRMRFDRITLWGTFLVMLQTQSTEPSGSNAVGSMNNVLLMIAGDGDDGFQLYSALDGSFDTIALVPSGFQLRDFDLECVGNAFTVRVDGEAVYGPISSSLRPTAIYMGNPVLAYWYPTNWCWLSVDRIRVDVPDPTSVVGRSWGAIKALYR